MLPAIVLIAEGLVVLWFAGFMTMIMSMYLESRSMPVPRLDLAARTLIGSAKLAFVTGMLALFVLTFLELPGIAG
ncbi:hypothetical protein E1180_19350 [Roseibium denhamense]|uniref:Uncharacterized protein n=1 Tax=Roseibium denhamense TaxID=76305 RepID=A0ABY1P1P1_9HYPH|nr:hypothetical protein [Roseibium denhamense]MTI07662.1 hypothetical protein [Roseibium denhamense]SMP24386.1 hypothetical protein SAMN06265374_2429 [Roseibium denhamense]